MAVSRNLTQSAISGSTAGLLAGLKGQKRPSSGSDLDFGIGTAGTRKPSSSSGSSSRGPSSSGASSAAAAQQAALAAARAAAQQSYQNQLAALEKAYADRAALWQQNYQNTIAKLEGDYKAGASAVDANTDRALQQAYVAYMLALRDLPQQLASLGVTGGSSESRLAGLRNGYGNTRLELERERGDSLADLLAVLSEGKSDALSDYRQTMAEDEARRLAYQMELEQNLAAALASLA